jgi:hypothetical protein
MDASIEDPDLDLIQPLINADGNGNVVQGSDDHRMLVFLYVHGVPQLLRNRTGQKAELFREILTRQSEGRERLMQIVKLLDDHEVGTDHHQHCPDTWLPKEPFISDSGLQQWVPGPDNESNSRLITIFNTFEPNQTKQSTRRNSYIAATTTFYAYAVKRETGEWKKVDVATYIRDESSP